MRACVGRDLDWGGCGNVRDLAGLPTADGRAIRRGALVRADALDRLTAHGWSALVAHGVRTVIDLRNDDERAPDVTLRPRVVRTVHLPLDAIEDREFWDAWSSGPQFGTPLYYRPHLERFPQRSARVVAAIAHARPSGVVVHCGIGRDRTGLVTLVVLALLGVSPEDIAADYARSAERLRSFGHATGGEDPGREVEEFLARNGTPARDLVLAMLASVDVAARLRRGGLTDGDAAALRARLLGPRGWQP